MKTRNKASKETFEYNEWQKTLRNNGNFNLVLGLVIGAALGLTAGLWLTSTSGAEAANTPANQAVPTKEPVNQSTVPTGASRKSVRPRVNTGRDDTPTGRTISNIDDLPDRG